MSVDIGRHYLCGFPFGLGITLPSSISRPFRPGLGVGVRSAMQLAMNASPAPRRCASVARCNCSKQKSSICLGADKAGVRLIKARLITTASTHSGFTFACPFRKPYPGRIRRNYGIGACSWAMVAILRLLIGALRNCFISRGRLEAEVIVLRHQLNILRRQSPRRVRPNAFDRGIFVCLYRHFPDIGKAVAIIRPETVIRWHRMGFRAWWRWKSRNPGGRPKIDPELRDLVRRLCEENPL
jgi:hypothetical protein